jgi:DNA-binding PadR family transcriptional regulator
LNLRFALLGLLASQPSSGFDIVRRFERTAGYAWSAHHSQIYPELARCLRDGLIVEVGSGPRGKRIYSTTPEGVAQLRAWLTDPAVDRTVRSEPTLRSFFTWAISPDHAADFYRGEAAYHRAALEQLRAIERTYPDVSELSGPSRSARITLERGLRLHALLAEWADWSAEAVSGGDRSGGRAPAVSASPAVPGA